MLRLLKTTFIPSFTNKDLHDLKNLSKNSDDKGTLKGDQDAMISDAPGVASPILDRIDGTGHWLRRRTSQS